MLVPACGPASAAGTNVGSAVGTAGVGLGSVAGGTAVGVGAEAGAQAARSNTPADKIQVKRFIHFLLSVRIIPCYQKRPGTFTFQNMNRPLAKAATIFVNDLKTKALPRL